MANVVELLPADKRDESPLALLRQRPATCLRGTLSAACAPRPQTQTGDYAGAARHHFIRRFAGNGRRSTAAIRPATAAGGPLRNLLAQSARSIGRDRKDNAGFTDRFHLSRHFSKHFGLPAVPPPAALRPQLSCLGKVKLGSALGNRCSHNAVGELANNSAKAADGEDHAACAWVVRVQRRRQ